MTDVSVSKSKFDALLGKMLATPPLPRSEIRVSKPKPRKKVAGAAKKPHAL